MSSMFNAAMRLCDDCGQERPGLTWWNVNISHLPGLPNEAEPTYL